MAHETRLLAMMLLLMSACADDMPTADLVLDERLLAIRVEAVAEPDRVEVLPFETVQIRPWIVDPSGPLSTEVIQEQMEPRWLACALPPRVAGLFGCLSSRFPLDPATIPICPVPDLGDALGGLPATNPSPCFLAPAPEVEPRYTVPLDPLFLVGGSVELTLVAHRRGRGSTDRCMAELFAGSDDLLPEECIYATQRIPIGPEAAIVQAASAFGIDLGPAPPEREPDRHPSITGFSVQAFSGEVALGSPIALTERGQVVTVPLGARLDLSTTAPVEDLQTYFSTGDQGLWIEETEAYDGRWYRTWGELWSPQSNDPRSINRWELVPTTQDVLPEPLLGRATMFYVLRDGRTGVDWWWFDVMVTPTAIGSSAPRR